MTTDPSTLTRDQLERLATVLLRHAEDGDDQETTLRAAHAILSEPSLSPSEWLARERQWWDDHTARCKAAVSEIHSALSAADATLAEPRHEPHPWTVREALLCITDVLEAHVRFADMKQKGMSVPFHGDFADAMRLPSFVGRVRWWARELRAALDSPRSETRHEPAPTDREMVERWVFGEHRDPFVVGRFYTITDEQSGVRIQLGVWREANFFPDHLAMFFADTAEKSYAAAAAWVKEQGK